MLKQFKTLPSPLQKQIIVRFSYAAGFLFVGIVSILNFRDLSVLAAGAAIVAFFIGYAVRLLRLALGGRYIVIHGVCRDVTVTAVKRRIKSLTLQTIVNDAEILVNLPIRHKMHTLQPGTALILYVAENTPVYETDGVSQLRGYLAIQTKGTANNNGGTTETGRISS
jgi:hypothetical protein